MRAQDQRQNPVTNTDRLIQIKEEIHWGCKHRRRQTEPRSAAVPYSARGYDERAEQCGLLATKTKDALLKRELLRLQETYRNIAACLRVLSGRDKACKS